MPSYSDVINEYSQVIFKTSAQEIGRSADLAEKSSKFGLNGHFTNVTFLTVTNYEQHLQNSGMPKNNSLNTAVDRERFMDNCKDWMEKIN